jgi:hypothetical protein
MAMLGGRHLQRETFAVYCEERGHAKPRFWFAGNAEDREPDPPLPSDSPSVATIQALTGDAPEARPAQRQYEEAWSEQGGYRVRALPPAVGGLSGRRATWLAGGLALGLSLLAAGLRLGQGGIGRSETGPVVGEQDGFPIALVSSLRSELAAARQTISSLKEEAALETAGPEAETARQELVLAAQTASDQDALLDRDLDAARQRIADLEAKADAAGAEAAILAKQLAVVRKMHAAVLEKFRAEAKERATNAGMLSTPAPSGTANVTNAPVSPRDAEGHAAAARPEPNAVAESIDVDSLVTNPSRYDARQVVVTGSLLRLLQNYRLQSKSTQKTLVVDVAGIYHTQHDMLHDAIAGAGLIGSVRVQISGKVVRGSAKAFSLVASDLILVE